MRTTKRLGGVLLLAAFAVACQDQQPLPTGPEAPAPQLSEQAAEQVPVVSDGEASVNLSGDNPLTTSFTYIGPVGSALDVVACNTSCPPGNLVISGIPAGASILQALLYIQSWQSGTTTASATLSGNPLGPSGPHATPDPGGGLTLRSYRFDVTGIVTGNGSYPYTISVAGQNYYVALVVVYSDASLASRILVINDGAESLRGATSTTTFAGMPVAGAGTLTVVVEADDDLSGGSETLSFNGGTILGPGDIFNANLGDFASLYQLPVAVVAGANTASIFTSADFFGWHLAILDAPGNRPPDCSAAAATPNVLWPPNHQFVPIQVVGVTDPDGDPFTITVDAIWQDEPTDTYGDGRFTPDGMGVGTSTAEVRAERAGTTKVPGNGRVYTISFTATDSFGGSCSSTVLVSVPHDQDGDPAVNDGPLYDSTN